MNHRDIIKYSNKRVPALVAWLRQQADERVASSQDAEYSYEVLCLREAAAQLEWLTEALADAGKGPCPSSPDSCYESREPDEWCGSCRARVTLFPDAAPDIAFEIGDLP